MFEELDLEISREAEESPLAATRRHLIKRNTWRAWLAAIVMQFVTKPFGAHHVTFWDWVWTIEDGVAPEPRAHINIWSRSHAKSTSAEAAVAMLCARGKRKYVVYVCRTQAQADQHVANIGGILESEAIADTYPTVGRRLVNPYGHSKGWMRSRLRSAAGFTIEAYGLDSAQRGAKIDEFRPDLIVFDDLDDPEDSEDTVQKMVDVLTRSLLPTGSRWLAVMGVQNLISDHGIFGRIVSGEGDFLKNRHLSGPIPAIEDLEWDIEKLPDGSNHYVVTGGRPTWAGYTLEDAQNDIDTYGLTSFLIEFQHEVGGKGNMFPADAWQELETMPACRRYVRAWDFAGTESNRSDFTVGVKMGRLNGRYYVVDVIRRRLTPDKVRELVLATAKSDGKRCRIVIPKDPGQAGISQTIDFGKGLAGYRVTAEPQTGKKATKAEPFSGQVGLGNVSVPKHAPWLKLYIAEHEGFPGGSRFDDQVDGSSSAFNWLVAHGEGRSGISGRRKRS